MLRLLKSLLQSLTQLFILPGLLPGGKLFNIPGQMKAKLGMLVTEASGSLGGHTFQNSKGGFQIRNKPIPRGNPSSAQISIRSINQQLQAGWRSLTTAQQKIWNDWPVIHGIMNAKGDKSPLSGHSLWMSYQFYSLRYSLPFLSYPQEFNVPPELLQSWQQVPGYPFIPFDVSGSKILLAKSHMEYGACNSLPAITGRVGDRFQVKISLSSTSDFIPYFGLIHLDPPTWIVVTTSITTRHSYHNFLLLYDSNDIHMCITVPHPSTISVTYCSFKKIP